MVEGNMKEEAPEEVTEFRLTVRLCLYLITMVSLGNVLNCLILTFLNNAQALRRKSCVQRRLITPD